MTTLRLPDIFNTASRWEADTHPDQAEVTDASAAWFASYNLMPSEKWNRITKEECYGLNVAMSFPYTDKERLRIANDWLTIIFVYDDLFDYADSRLMKDENGAIEASKIMLSVFTEPDKFKPDNRLPMATVVHDFWARFRGLSTLGQQKRFLDTVSQYAAAATDQVGNRERKKHRNINEYVALRRETSAVKNWLALSEFCLQIDVPENVLHHPVIKGIQEAVNDIISWSNDIHSFNREQAAGDYSNLVAIVAIEKDIPIQAAITYVYIMYTSAMDRYFELCAAVPSFDSEADEIVSRYLKGTHYLISGCLRWSFTAERYFGPSVEQVKKTSIINLLPLEANAIKPEYELQYTIKF